MAFYRHDLLPDRNRGNDRELTARWKSQTGTQVASAIIDGIKNGAGKYFMDHIFEAHDVGILRNSCDLAGLDMSTLDVCFDEDDDTFKYIDFCYSQWYNTSFRNGSFFQCYFDFVRFSNVHFTDCIFSFTSFYGCTFDRCVFERCDFVDENGFTNCRFSDISVFDDCFFNKNKLIDCSIDLSSQILNCGGLAYLQLRSRAHRFNECLDVKNIAGIMQGIKEGFANNAAYQKSRDFSFKQSQAHTRFNARFKIQHYFWEYLAGYGLKPARVFSWYIIVFFMTLLWFLTKTNKSSDAIFLSAGAVLTFGAKADLLDNLGAADIGVYVFSAFAGVSLLSLLVTVLAAKILAES